MLPITDHVGLCCFFFPPLTGSQIVAFLTFLFLPINNLIIHFVLFILKSESIQIALVCMSKISGACESKMGLHDHLSLLNVHWSSVICKMYICPLKCRLLLLCSFSLVWTTLCVRACVVVVIALCFVAVYSVHSYRNILTSLFFSQERKVQSYFLRLLKYA